MPCYSPRIAITLWSSAHTHQDSPVSGKTKSRENLQSIRSSEKLVHISSIEKTIGGSESFSYPPPLQTLSSSRNLSEKTIFVGIVSYRDSECPHTIRNIFQKAWNAHRVFVGVVYQVDQELDEDCILSLPLQETCLQCGKKSAGTVCDFTDNIRSLTMPWQQARGPCYARHLVSSLWNGEDYYFQLDSHMRLRANWDRYLVELLEELKHDADDQSKVRFSSKLIVIKLFSHHIT